MQPIVGKDVLVASSSVVNVQILLLVLAMVDVIGVRSSNNAVRVAIGDNIGIRVGIGNNSLVTVSKSVGKSAVAIYLLRQRPSTIVQLLVIPKSLGLRGYLWWLLLLLLGLGFRGRSGGVFRFGHVLFSL